MSLDQKALDLITAKDSYLEVYWLDPDTVAYLQAAQPHAQLWRLNGGIPELLSAASPLGSALPYGGNLVASRLSQIFALGLDQQLYDLTNGTQMALPGPASDLNFSAHGDLTLVSYDGETNRDSLYRWADGLFLKLWESPDYLRQVQWHPTEAKCVLLSWARDALPWHEASLIHVDCTDKSSPIIARLEPPGLERSPCAEVCYSPNGKYLTASFLTGDYFQLWLYRIDTRNWVQLTFDARERSTPLRRSSRRSFGFVDDGLIVTSSSEKGFWKLETIDFRGHARKVPSDLTQMSHIKVATGGTAFLALASGMQYPQQPVQFTRNGPSWTARRHGPKLASRLRSESVTWATDSGETVHGILYRDRNAKAPCPLIMPIHGGPTDAVQATWPAKALAFVLQGYAVLYVNYRGSWGYGFDYHQSLAGQWGIKDVSDCVNGVESLAALGWIDRERVGLWGGGTASYTVLWALIRHPEIFHAGIAVFPILDLVHHFAHCSLAEMIELTWALGTNEPRLLHDRSPLHAMASLRRPLGLFAGANDGLLDSRVLQNVADELKKNRVPCWLSIYEGEGRAWRNHDTYIDYYSQVSGFFDRFLRFRGPQ